MDSEPSSINQLFKPERQYCVPLYQRAYVWNQEDQWSRLWSDIQEKAEARLAGYKPTPHFMGALVLDPQGRQKLIGVEKVHIIDGQQRMTTFQFVLAALAIVLRTKGFTELLPAIESCLQNSDQRNMRDKAVEPFKVWPTYYDRDFYIKTIVAESLDDLRLKFPDHFTQRGSLKKIGILHPPVLAAIWYFAEKINQWLPTNGRPDSDAIEALAEAILEDFLVISITLNENDDAQVIFETLNGHGVELTATDLIRNYVFLKADVEGSNSAELYSSYWSRYESQSWKVQERRGRLNRPRMEWFIQTVLQAEMREEVDQGRIYAEYQRYAKKSGTKANEQLALLDDYADFYEAMLDGNLQNPIGRFGNKFKSWDASTTYVLALAIAKSGSSEIEQDEMFNILGSYLIRRAICGLTNKNYNKVFLQVLKNLKSNQLTVQNFRVALEGLSGEASRWPKDDEFKHAFISKPMYTDNLDAPKMRSVLVELENVLRTERTEEPVAPVLENLDIDHMLPQSWYEHWALPDGSFSTYQESIDVRYLPPDIKLSPKQTMIKIREALVPTIGNLTLLHYGANRAAKNYAFSVKQDQFLNHSNLHLNRQMLTAEKWDESTIQNRAEVLFDAAVKIWSGPSC